MRHFWLLLAPAVTAGLLAAVPTDWAVAQEKDNPKETTDEPAVPETPGKLTLTLDPGGHTATVGNVFFTPDSKQIVTVSMDHSARVWDALSGEAVRVLYPPGFGGLTAATLSPDGQTLAVGTRYADGDKVLPLIYLLALADGRVERVLKGHPEDVEALAFSPDGKRLASTSAGKDGTVRVWNPATGELEKEFRFAGDPFSVLRGAKRGLAFSPDGSRLARVRLSGGAGDILDLATGKAVAKLPGWAVAWSPDGKTLATALRDKDGEGVQLWDPDGTPRQRLLAGQSCHSVAFSADSRALLVTWGGLDREETGLFDVATGEQLVETDAKNAKTGALSPDLRLAATATNRLRGVHGLTVWKAADGKVVQQVWPAPSLIMDTKSTGWSGDGRAVCWPGPRGRRTFDLARLEFTRALAPKDLRGSVTRQGALSLEGPKVLKDGAVLATLKGYHQTLVGTDRAAWTARGEIVLCEAATGKELHHLQGHHDQVTGLAPSPDGRFLLSTSSDQTLKVWNVEQGKALLSLYVQGHDWIAWTEEGYYAATPGGERLMGWKVENGIDQAPCFYPAERFRKQLYRPDVVKLLLEKGGVEEALKAARAAREKEGLPAEGRADLRQLLPPRAALQVVGKSGPKVKVRATAEEAAEGQPVTALRLLVDGRPLPEGGGVLDLKSAQEKAEAEWEVELPPGSHELKVLARSPDTAGASPAVPLDVPLSTPAQPTLHVIAVGIDEYAQKALKLECAVSDAREIAQAFKEHCAGKGNLFGDVKATTLLNGDATREAVLGALKGARQAVKPGDLLVFSFAGHGARQGKQFYLLTVDADPANLAKTALSGEDLRAALADLPCQVLLLLDACHSAAGVRAFIDEAARNLTDDDTGVAVLCAAMGHEEAQEAGGHGLFTRAVLEALAETEGVPFNRRDRRQYVHHLGSFVLDEVQAASHDEQHPFLTLPYVTESFPVRLVPARVPGGSGPNGR